MQLAVQEACAVAAVHATREHLIGNYGTVTGKHLSQLPGVYQIERIIEKPSLSQAEMELLTPGLRAGHFLCFFGMHVLTPCLFDILDEQQGTKRDGKVDCPLTPALQELARREKYLALEVQGARYNIGRKFGLLQAQVALGLAGKEHDEVLTTLMEQLIDARQTASLIERARP